MQLLAEKLLAGSFCMTIVFLCCSKNNEVVIHSGSALLPSYCYCSSSSSQTVEHKLFINVLYS